MDEFRAAVEREVRALAQSRLRETIYEQNERFHWDAPLNSYATGDRGAGLFIWKRDRWEPVFTAEEFTVSSLDRFEDELKRLIVKALEIF